MDHPTQLDLLGGLPMDFYTIEMHLEDLEDLESGPPDEFGGRMLMANICCCTATKIKGGIEFGNHTWK